MDEIIQNHLRRQLRDLYNQLSTGMNPAPARYHRLEGMMQAAVMLGLMNELEIDQLLEQCHDAAFGKGLEQEFGPEWRRLKPFPAIPIKGKRAPVYAST